MSIQPIIQSLEKLIDIHRTLLDISEEKTEWIKQGTAEKIQQVLIKERKHVRLLEKEEENRQLEAEKWAIEHGLPKEDVTITYLLDHMKNGTEKEELAEKSRELVEVISNLKQQESLNQMLLEQSMQFVQVSLDLLQPSIKNINYGNQKKDNKSYNRSLFDSQA